MADMNPNPGDIRSGVLLGKAAQQAQEVAEVQVGMRCGGCKRRFTEGYELFGFQMQAQLIHNGGPGLAIMRTCACKRDDCEFLAIARERSVGERPLTWAYLDEKPTLEEKLDAHRSSTDSDAAS